MSRQRIAVIGGGISGGLVANLLHEDHDIVLFEADQQPGGHAKTVECDISGKIYNVDVGFMVFNDRTYPNFCRLLKNLDVPSRESDMSFSVKCEQSQLEYQGGNLRGLFPSWRNRLDVRFWKMLYDILRFNRVGNSSVDSSSIPDDENVGQFLDRNRLGRMFREKYLLPMAAAIWSANPQQINAFPAKFLIGFFRNHGLMSLRDRPQWRTIVGGSKTYVEKLIAPFRDRVRLATPVNAVTRHGDFVTINSDRFGDETFDRVVFATHADITRRLLRDITPHEENVLKHFPYQANEAVLHTDTSILPQHQAAWASWNYLIPAEQPDSASVTYDLSRLQGVPSPRPILLTLNQTDKIEPSSIIRTFSFDHPAYDISSAAAQQQIASIQGTRRAYFCGAYCGYGFHEDGVNSALAVAALFGKNLSACNLVSTKEPSTTYVANR